MLYAVIDIGSTTIRMAIYEILDNKLNLIHKAQIYCRFNKLC